MVIRGGLALILSIFVFAYSGQICSLRGGVPSSHTDTSEMDV